LKPLQTAINGVEAYALWLFDVGGATEDPLILEGIFENIDDAKADLRSNGYLKKTSDMLGFVGDTPTFGRRFTHARCGEQRASSALEKSWRRAQAPGRNSV
jgi:hypothetical protein